MITLHGERVKTLISRFLQKRIDATAAKNILKIFAFWHVPLNYVVGKSPKCFYVNIYFLI